MRVELLWRFGRAASASDATVPWPSVLEIRSSPSISSTRRRESTRPMPVPSIFEFSAPRRLKGSNRRSSFSEVMPRPLSVDAHRAAFVVDLPSSRVTLPPMRLYLTALLSRLTSTWRMRTLVGEHPDLGPASRRCGAATSPDRARRQAGRRLSAASGDTIDSASATAASRSTASIETIICPDSTRDRSSTSLTSASRCAAGVLDVLDAAELLAPSAAAPRRGAAAARSRARR